MVNDKDTAILISDLMLRFGKELDESVAVVQSRCDEDEFNVYRETVGFIMGEMLIKIMNPLYEKHPEIKPKGLKQNIWNRMNNVKAGGVIFSRLFIINYSLTPVPFFCV